MISLERRFVTGLATTLLVVFALLFWGSITAVRSLSEAYVLARLEHDAEALVGALWVNPSGQTRLREGRITPIYQQPLSGHYFVVSLADGTEIRSRSLWDETLEVPSLMPGEVRAYLGPGPVGQRLQLRSAGYSKGGMDFSLTVAEDMAPMAADIRRFQMFALTLLGFALLAIVLIQRYVVRRGFRVLDEVREQVRQVSTGQLQQLQEPGPLEIRPLTAELNRLLKQVQQRLQRSRRSLGNLAHALKAPLSLMTRELDRLPLPAADSRRLSEQLNRISALIERELKRARLAGEGGGQHFVPRRQVPELIEVLRQMYATRGLDISCGPLPDAVLPFDYEDMLELLGNLLDNACKWASRRVELQIALDDGMVIRVADDGPGVPEDQRAPLLRRGSRLDEQEAGHGLGLAIVKDLVGDYHGSIGLARSSTLGGLEVSVVLPLPAHHA
ncbi:MAG: sensor histidine kinase [Sedimenticolaceae bacterium]